MVGRPDCEMGKFRRSQSETSGIPEVMFLRGSK